MGRIPSMGLSIAYTGQKKASLISKVCGASTKGVKSTYKDTRRRRKKAVGDIFETITTENFLPIHVSHWITDPGSSAE